MFKRMILAAGACLLLSLCVSAAPADDESRRYLDARPPGPRSAVVCSLNGWPIREETSSTLEQQFREWGKNGFDSVVEYETALLSLIKLQEPLGDYQNMDLLSQLYAQDALEQDGLDGVIGALLVYGASGLEIPQSQPNSPNALIDHILAAQQKSGGFAERPGEAPNVAVTARALTALYPYANGPDVHSTAERALRWLETQQNGDGTFSVKGLPSGGATAETLLAISLYQPGSGNFSKGGGIESALSRFRNQDGSYSEILGGGGFSETTELALIALFTARTGSFPYYAPTRYPGYIAPVAPDSESVSESPWVAYGKFFFGFLLIFFLIYLLLLLTVKIGKIAEQKKLPGSLAAQEEKAQKQAFKLEETMQMHIPMQAQIPDFDKISEQESEIGHPGDDSSIL